ncbi:baseplate J/gp47 family protein [Actinobacillus genomosp. 2]|uniref:baseplate J/gp47 family protein n=1 Tax=Actinobacillus genomosp. 2 TaxID=230709 RepID=UPI002442E196|nr:baseplate J/gp47 family protein [Actinobacillus genomosp. 2]WGE32559.1 baseplate J/gp47 family protein [Actinobacillus genomosp. 2]
MSENFREILAETGLPVEEVQIRQEFERLTEQENLITNTSRMSPFWRLITAVAVHPVKWLTDSLINEIVPNLFVKTAKGAWLRILAWQVGIEPKPASQAKGTVTFTKESSSLEIEIPVGTVMQTERINEVVYKVSTTESVIIPRGQLSAKVPVIAENAGSSYNLAGGYYCILPKAVSGILKAENSDDWLEIPGADEETDDELRERYRIKFSSVGKHHIDSVYKSIVAEITGISVDRIYFLHDAPRGPGTANIYLLLDTGVPSQVFIDTVNDYLMNKGYHGHGDDIRAFSIPDSFHDVALTIYFRTSDIWTQTKKENIKQNVENMIRCAFRENNDFKVTKTYPYTRFSFSKLGEEIHEAYPEIRSIEWKQHDILSDLSIPRLQSLTVEVKDD